MIRLTDYQAFVLFNSISLWDQKNKAKETPFLDLQFFKTLLKIKNELRVTVEAITETNIPVIELYKQKETTEYDIPFIDEAQAEKAQMFDSVEAVEIFGWIIKP